MPDVVELDHPEAFGTLAEPLLTAMPVEHTVIATVLHEVRTGVRPASPARWWVVRDDTQVIGLAMWTPPRAPYVGPMPAAAADAVGEALSTTALAPDGLNGESEAVLAALAGYQRRSPPATVTGRWQVRLYQADHLTPPSVPGTARPAADADYSLLLRWHHAFAVDIDHPAIGIEDDVRRRLERQALLLWAVDGAPVAMAGHTAAVAGVVRVGPVYTPPERRGRGYGAAVTAEVSRRALARGARRVVLFADLANPTSNKIYTEIGYRPVRDYLEVELAAPDSSQPRG